MTTQQTTNKRHVDIAELEAAALANGYAQKLFADLSGQKRQGSDVIADCPFCGKAGKFSYSLERPIARCWSASCRAHEGVNWAQYGDLRYGWTFVQYLEDLGRFTGLEARTADPETYRKAQRRGDVLETAQAWFIEALSRPEASHVLDYLYARGYTAQEIDGMGFGAYVDRAGLIDTLTAQGFSHDEINSAGLLTGGFGDTHQLTLLWRDVSGKPIGLITRSLWSRDELKRAGGGDKYKYSRGLEKSKSLLGLDVVRRLGAEEAILVEGPLDARLLIHYGYPAVSSGGASLSADQARALEAAGVRRVLLAYDQDDAGYAGAEKAISRLLDHTAIRPFALVWDAEYKDVDDLILRFAGDDRPASLEYFGGVVNGAWAWPEWHVSRLKQRYDTNTDAGTDAALEEALRALTATDDPLDRRAYLDAVGYYFKLDPQDVHYRLAQHEKRQRADLQKGLLQRVQSDVAGKVAEGDLTGAERALEDGLSAVRRARGAAAPTPYLWPDFEADLANMTAGLSLGYDSLAGFRIPEGAITIVAGRPGHGKTTFQLNLLARLLDGNPGKRFYFYSYEEARGVLLRKLIMLHAGVELHAEQNQLAYLNYLKEKRGTDQRIERVINGLARLMEQGRLWLQDAPLPAEDLAASIDDLAARGDTGAVFVDYIQKVPVREARPTRQAEVARASELLRAVAVKHNIPIIMGAQFNRQAGTEPRLEHLREAGDIEQDASLVLSVFNRSEDTAQQQEDSTGARAQRPKTMDLLITVLKHRGGPAGTRHVLTFNGPTLQITDKAGNNGRRSV